MPGDKKTAVTGGPKVRPTKSSRAQGREYDASGKYSDTIKLRD